MGDTDPKAKAAVDAHKQAAASEEEVYATLGALLGTLEVIAADDYHPLDEVQLDRLRGAGRLGRRIHYYLEALLILSAEDLSERLRRTRSGLRSLVEHALRGAIRSCEAYAVTQRLPPASAWGEGKVLVDASRIDRVLGALVEALASQLGYGGSIEVTAELARERAVLQLIGHRGSAPPPIEQGLGFGEEVNLLASFLLNRAWARLFALHGGELQVEPEQLRIRITLPMLEAT